MHTYEFVCQKRLIQKGKLGLLGERSIKSITAWATAFSHAPTGASVSIVPAA
jgi:hypothetical protein